MRPWTPWRAWDFTDHVGVRIALDKMPQNAHGDWVKAALTYLKVKHVRTNSDTAAALAIMRMLNRDLGVRFHYTSFRPARNATEPEVRTALYRRPDWIVAQGLKGMTDGVESLNEWDGEGAVPNLWRDQLHWAQQALWSKRPTLRS